MDSSINGVVDVENSSVNSSVKNSSETNYSEHNSVTDENDNIDCRIVELTDIDVDELEEPNVEIPAH